MLPIDEGRVEFSELRYPLLIHPQTHLMRLVTLPSSKNPGVGRPFWGDKASIIWCEPIVRMFKKIPPCLDGYVEFLYENGNPIHDPYVLRNLFDQKQFKGSLCWHLIDYFYHPDTPFAERYDSLKRIGELLPSWCSVIQLTRVDNEEELLYMMKDNPFLVYRSPRGPYHWGRAGKKTLSMGNLFTPDVVSGYFHAHVRGGCYIVRESVHDEEFYVNMSEIRMDSDSEMRLIGTFGYFRRVGPRGYFLGFKL